MCVDLLAQIKFQIIEESKNVLCLRVKPDFCSDLTTNTGWLLTSRFVRTICLKKDGLVHC